MARRYATIKVHMWEVDDEFRALPPEAQHLYFVLLTSPRLNLAGVADWRPKRIANLAAGWTEQSVRMATQLLIDRDYLVADESTEEILIRSFVKNDGVLRNPKVTAGMVSDWGSIYSTTIKACVADQVRAAIEAGEGSPSIGSSIASLIAYRADWVSDQVCEGVSDRAPEGVSDQVCEGVSDRAPEGVSDQVSDQVSDSPSTFYRLPSTDQPPTPIGPPRSPKTPPVGEEGFEQWWQAYPRKLGKGQARKAYTTALRKASDTVLLDAAREFAKRTKDADPKFIPHPATWLNGERWTDQPDVKKPARIPGATEWETPNTGWEDWS